MVDILKPASIAAALALLYAACTPSQPDKQPHERLPAVATATAVRSSTSEVCGTPSDVLKPPSFRAKVVAYPGGMVINKIADTVELEISLRDVNRINNKPELSLNLPPDTLSVMYFINGSTQQPDMVHQFRQDFLEEKDFLAALYCEQQGQYPRQGIYFASSLYDSLTAVTQKEPTLRPEDPSWRIRLEREFGRDYINGRNLAIRDTFKQPVNSLSPDIVDEALKPGVPFRINKYNAAYPYPAGLAPQ